MVAHAISVHQIACDAGDWDVSSQMSISDCIPVTRETFHKLVFAAVCCKHAVSIRPVFVIDPILRFEDDDGHDERWVGRSQSTQNEEETEQE